MNAGPARNWTAIGMSKNVVSAEKNINYCRPRQVNKLPAHNLQDIELPTAILICISSVGTDYELWTDWHVIKLPATTQSCLASVGNDYKL